MGPATRDAYGEALLEMGEKNKRIVVLDGDLSKSTKSALFGKAFPDRFFNVGICEANMIGLASGLALSGYLPFCSSFASFLLCKSYDQLRIGVAYTEANVKLFGSHGGISIGEDGPSQMGIEDIALACSLPHFTVLVPADAHAMRCAVSLASSHTGPVYLRGGRPKVPIIYSEEEEFTIGKAKKLREGADCAIFALGIEVFEALLAAERLEAEGISCAVYDPMTVKPLDEAAVKEAAEACGAIVTAEEHQIYGGLGSIVSQVVARLCPVPVQSIALKDTYAESGSKEALLEKYGLTAPFIADAVRQVLARKKR